MEKIQVDAEFVCLNYKPYEGWGRHRQLILDHLEFKRFSPNKVILAHPYKIELKPGEKAIFLTTVESDSVREDEIRTANEANGLIVPANWVKEVYQHCGIRVPIMVVPEGVTNNEVYNPSPSPFTFLHFDATSADNRKGGDLVSEAFINVFGNMGNKVRLIMKGRNHQIPLVHRYTNIEYIFQDYSDREMGWLWEKTNCFVFPSRGEGFGLPPLEAMAHGIPTIVTYGSALQSFAQLGIPLRVSKKIPAIYDGKGGVGFWDLPDEQQLRILMLSVYQNYEEEKRRAVTKAQEVWDIYNFEKVAPVLAETITKMFTNEEKDTSN